MSLLSDLKSLKDQHKDSPEILAVINETVHIMESNLTRIIEQHKKKILNRRSESLEWEVK